MSQLLQFIDDTSLPVDPGIFFNDSQKQVIRIMAGFREYAHSIFLPSNPPQIRYEYWGKDFMVSAEFYSNTEKTFGEWLVEEFLKRHPEYNK